jgi:hypothetical protein
MKREEQEIKDVKEISSISTFARRTCGYRTVTMLL